MRFGRSNGGHEKKPFNLRTALVGDFDYGFLCMPRWPFCRKPGSKNSEPPFYGINQSLGVLTALIMGLQHALAMAGGLVTPPLLVGMLSDDPFTKSYLIQASLLVCGITTFIQVTGFDIPRTPFKWGSGLLSVMGVSFASVPLMTSVVKSLIEQGHTFDEAFGKMLGTAAICAVWPVLLSFMPYKALRRTFPPIVTGVTIFLIGAKLVATGFKYWGGGVFCGENYKHLPAPTLDCLIPGPNGTTVTAPCFNANIAPMCRDNGEVVLPYGSGPYVGMGLLVFLSIIIIEMFGSPFMRNASLVLALLIGIAVAAAVRVDGKRFLTGTIVRAAPPIVFLWVKTFPLGFYPPAVLPFLIVFSITSVETVGDVTATAELSLLDVDDEAHVRRIRGGILHDGISGVFSALSGSMPLTTFAQNNGVIALTNVASRQAGWAAAGWLFLWGLIGKFGGLVLTIPHCVLGGATSFLFASVVTSGIKILMMGDGFTRRNRFIVSCSLAFGLGVSFVPQWATNALWPANPAASSGAASVRLAILLVLETGFCLGAIVAFLLNLAIPNETAAAIPKHADAARPRPTRDDAMPPYGVDDSAKGTMLDSPDTMRMAKDAAATARPAAATAAAAAAAGPRGAMAAAPRARLDEENEIAKGRVITLTSNISRGGAPAKTLAQRWLAFVDAAQNGSPASAEDAYYRFLLALADMELLGRKLAATQAASRRELETYEHKRQELAASIATAKEVIEAKKQQLAEARLWRQQQEEYEVLRRAITAVAPRHETQAAIDAVEGDIASIRASIARQNTTFDVIAKKCAAVRHQVEDLLNSFPRADGGAAAPGGGEPGGSAAGGGGAAPMAVDG
ncbi:uapA [Scenedesmus sp. PABB004]|nr:uapA [Scenedesmus sp. PABB004]